MGGNGFRGRSLKPLFQGTQRPGYDGWKGRISRCSSHNANPLTLGTIKILCKSSSDSASCLLLGLTFSPTFFPADFYFSHCSGPWDTLHHCFVSDLAQLITNGSQSLCLQPPKGRTFKLASIKCLSIASSIDVLLS